MTGFNDPYELVKVMVQKDIPRDKKIIDFGCGTGLTGVQLTAAGYKDIYGLDGSKDMLQVALSKNLYVEGHVVLVGIDELPDSLLYKPEVEGSGFDIVTCSACMIRGHFTNACFEEFIKVLRPGGHMIFTIRDIYLNPETDNGMEFKGKLHHLEQQGLIK